MLQSQTTMLYNCMVTCSMRASLAPVCSHGPATEHNPSVHCSTLAPSRTARYDCTRIAAAESCIKYTASTSSPRHQYRRQQPEVITSTGGKIQMCGSIHAHNTLVMMWYNPNSLNCCLLLCASLRCCLKCYTYSYMALHSRSKAANTC